MLIRVFRFFAGAMIFGLLLAAVWQSAWAGRDCSLWGHRNGPLSNEAPGLQLASNATVPRRKVFVQYYSDCPCQAITRFFRSRRKLECPCR